MLGQLGHCCLDPLHLHGINKRAAAYAHTYMVGLHDEGRQVGLSHVAVVDLVGLGAQQNRVAWAVRYCEQRCAVLPALHIKHARLLLHGAATSENSQVSLDLVV